VNIATGIIATGTGCRSIITVKISISGRTGQNKAWQLIDPGHQNTHRIGDGNLL
jgi:hypothetical protein